MYQTIYGCFEHQFSYNLSSIDEHIYANLLMLVGLLLGGVVGGGVALRNVALSLLFRLK